MSIRIYKLICKLNIKFLAVGILVFSTSANALVILQQASSSFDTQYDTNPLLREDAKSIWRHTITPRYTVSAVENQNRWYADAGLALQRSSDKRVTQDRQDPNFDAGWEHEMERGRFSVVGRYLKQSSRFAEFSQNGFVDGDGSSITKSISANWTKAITERLSYTLGSQYIKLTYDSSQFSDTVTKSLNSSLTYELNERISPFIRLSYTDLKSDVQTNNNGLLINNLNGFFLNNNFANGGNSKSRNISFGTTVLLGPNWTLSANIGVNKIDSENQNTNSLLGVSSGSGKIGGLSLINQRERSTFNAGLSRSVSPSGIGGFVESDRLNLGYNYLLNEKSSLNAGFNLNKNKSNFDSQSTQFLASYSRELTEMWQMRILFQSRMQQNSIQNQSVNVSGNVIGLTFTYSTPEF